MVSKQRGPFRKSQVEAGGKFLKNFFGIIKRIHFHFPKAGVDFRVSETKRVNSVRVFNHVGIDAFEIQLDRIFYIVRMVTFPDFVGIEPVHFP